MAQAAFSEAWAGRRTTAQMGSLSVRSLPDDSLDAASALDDDDDDDFREAVRRSLHGAAAGDDDNDDDDDDDLDVEPDLEADDDEADAASDVGTATLTVSSGFSEVGPVMG